MTPLEVSCTHSPTEAERQRDPEYFGCFAQPKQPCQWVRGGDGGEDPPFHSERIETAFAGHGSEEPVDKNEFDNAVEGDGSIF